MVGYTHCLEPGSDFRLLADWFRYWSANSWKARIAAKQQGTTPVPTPFDDALEVISTAVDCCLEPTGWKGLDFSMAREEMVISHPEQGELPVAMLSDGVRSMLGLVADIAFRAAKLNPNLGPYAAQETRGVVLIDEVDMHLHPAWQQRVLGQLMEAFPKIQFIVSTHSPQVLSSVKKENIRVRRVTFSPKKKEVLCQGFLSCWKG
jgi:predicted ATP-binding protein involved in virulence